MRCTNYYNCVVYRVGNRPQLTVHSFNHSEYFYNASSSSLGLLLRGAPVYSTDTVS